MRCTLGPRSPVGVSPHAEGGPVDRSSRRPGVASPAPGRRGCAGRTVRRRQHGQPALPAPPAGPRDVGPVDDPAARHLRRGRALGPAALRFRRRRLRPPPGPAGRDRGGSDRDGPLRRRRRGSRRTLPRTRRPRHRHRPRNRWRYRADGGGLPIAPPVARLHRGDGGLRRRYRPGASGRGSARRAHRRHPPALRGDAGGSGPRRLADPAAPFAPSRHPPAVAADPARGTGRDARDLRRRVGDGFPRLGRRGDRPGRPPRGGHRVGPGRRSGDDGRGRGVGPHRLRGQSGRGIVVAGPGRADDRSRAARARCDPAAHLPAGGHRRRAGHRGDGDRRCRHRRGARAELLGRELGGRPAHAPDPPRRGHGRVVPRLLPGLGTAGGAHRHAGRDDLPGLVLRPRPARPAAGDHRLPPGAEPDPHGGAGPTRGPDRRVSAAGRRAGRRGPPRARTACRRSRAAPPAAGRPRGRPGSGRGSPR